LRYQSSSINNFWAWGLLTALLLLFLFDIPHVSKILATEFCFSLAERDNKWWMLQGHLVATSVNRNGFFETKSWVTELDPEMQPGSDLGPQ
jgi:hypothetical protein